MKKMFFMTILFGMLFKCLPIFADDICNLTDDGEYCQAVDGRLYISPSVMNFEYNQYLSTIPETLSLINNGVVEEFMEDIAVDGVGNVVNYTIFSLTNFKDTDGRLH